MKILAIEKEIPGATWDNTESLLKKEARYVFELYLSDIMREIYFTENNSAVLVLEAKSKLAAKQTLNALPLVKSGKIKFDIMELRPYNGYLRLINQ